MATPSETPAVPPEIRVVVDGAEGVAEGRLAQAVVAHARRSTRLDWRWERLFPGSDDAALLLRARPTTDDPLEVAAIGLLVRRELSAREDVAQAAVDLPVDAYQPVHDPQPVHDLQPERDPLPVHDHQPERDPAAFGGRRRPPGTEDPGWVHRVLHVPDAWAVSAAADRPARGAGVVIGHPDTGYTEHPHLGRAALDLGRDRDLVDGDDDARDPLEPGPLLNPGHGTATGSVIAGRAAGALPPLGVAPDATLLPLRAIRSVIQVFDSDVARAVDHARRHNAHVISMSLGGKGFFGLQRAIQRAVDAGIIVCAAAGNNVRFVVAPASYANTIGVGGTDVDDAPWSGSSRGRRVDVCAPAEAVHAAGFDWAVGGAPVPVVGRTDGTSFAVAAVAGIAALWLAHHGRGALIERYGASQLVAAFRHLLAGDAVRRPPRWDDRTFGSGVIDALAVLRADLPAPEEVAAAGAFAERDDAAGRLAALLGDVDAAAVLARTTALSRFRDEATVAAWLARNEDELAYLLLTEPGLRERFTADAGAFSTEPPALAHATDGVRAVLGTARARIEVAPPAPGPALRRPRPFDRATVDLSMVAGDTGRLGPERMATLAGRLGTGWSPTAAAPDAVVTGRVDSARMAGIGAFGASVTPFQAMAGAIVADAAPTVDTVRVASQESVLGRHEVRHLTLRGREVVGTDVRVTMTRHGGMQVSGRVLALPADLDPGPPPAGRRTELGPAVRDLLALPPDTELRAELVVLPTPGELIWAYKVKAYVEEPVADLRAYLRADDLGLLVSHDVALAAAVPVEGRAHVFASNPGRDPAVVEVALSGLHEPGDVLSGRTFEVLAHRRDRLTRPDRDFRVDPSAPAFDEPNVYHHLTRALEWCVGVLGRDPLRDNDYRPLQAIVGHRLARQARGQYVPADRSFRFDDLERTAARSADVIYHEFAHAVTDAVSRLYRSPGVAARGVAEGIADYVACSMLDDPRFGDWVLGRADGARNCADPSLRFSAVDHTDEHALGGVWAALLWDLRTQLGTPVTDQLVLAGLHHLVPGSTLEGALEALVATDGALHPGDDHEQEIRRAAAARQ